MPDELPPEQVDEVVASEVEATVTETPEPSPLIEEIRSMGFDLGDDATLETAVPTLLEQIRADQPYVNFARQTYQQPEPEPEPQQEEEWSAESHFASKYGSKGWDESWQKAIDAGFIERGEDGRWVPVRNEIQFAQLASKVNSAQAHSQSFWQQMSTGNPFSTFYDAMQEPISRAIEEKVNAILEGRDAQNAAKSAVDGFISEHSSWLYRKDPSTGQDVLTEQGQAFQAKVEELEKMGVTDRAQQLKLATELLGVGKEPELPEPPKEELEKKSFLETAKERVKQTASQAPPTTDDSPNVATEGELDNLWMTEARRQFAR